MTTEPTTAEFLAELRQDRTLATEVLRKLPMLVTPPAWCTLTLIPLCKSLLC